MIIKNAICPYCRNELNMKAKKYGENYYYHCKFCGKQIWMVLDKSLSHYHEPFIKVFEPVKKQ